MNTSNNIIQVNKFAEIAKDREGFFFSHASHLPNVFEKIRKYEKDAVLISGNSDIAINDSFAEAAPKNVKKWFAVNNVSSFDWVKSIPLGIENSFDCCIKGEGVGWDHAKEKVELLSKSSCIAPQRLFYGNFNIGTNPRERGPLARTLKERKDTTWKECSLNYEEYVFDILDHEAVFCPVGNGLDTHRLWETLALGRVPIVVGDIGKLSYRLYGGMPIVYLPNACILNTLNTDTLRTMVDIARGNDWSKAKFEYWENLVTKG